MKDGDANKDDRQDSSSSEKDLYGPEKSSKFFLTLLSLCQSKNDKFENKAAGCHGLVGDTEVLHSLSPNQNQVQKEKCSCCDISQFDILQNRIMGQSDIRIISFNRLVK